MLKDSEQFFYRDNVYMSYPVYQQGLAIFGENSKGRLGESG